MFGKSRAWWASYFAVAMLAGSACAVIERVVPTLAAGDVRVSDDGRKWIVK